MAEPVTNEQILSELAAINATIAAFNARFGGNLVAPLNTAGYEIQGAELDEDEYAPPMNLRANADMHLLSEAGTHVHNGVFPDLPFYGPPSSGVITPDWNGWNLAFDGAEDIALSLDEDIQIPDGIKRWVFMIHNESATAAINLTAAGGVTINGTLDVLEIVAGTSRLVTRKADGFRVQ